MSSVSSSPRPSIRPKLFIGIDPGRNGGIAWLEDKVVGVCKMPDTERGVWELIRGFSPTSMPGHDIYAYIEQVQGYVGRGKGGQEGEGGQPGSYMFNFGMGYGGLRMAMIAAGIPFDKVSPSVWQKALGIDPRGTKTQTEHKNILKAKASELFPGTKMTLAKSDAILLAYYCRLRKG